MGITEKMKERRKKYLGSSDASAVLGLNPFRSPADVYFDKTGQIEDRGKSDGNDAIEVGNWCEDAVLRWFADKQDLEIIRNQFRVSDNGVMAANFDAIVKGDPIEVAIEAKTHAVTSNWISDQWGEVGTGDVPDHIKLQCYHQMACVPTVTKVHIPVLMGGVGFRSYVIERDEEMIENLIEAELNFWNDHVLAGKPPSDSMPTLTTFKRLKREPDKSIDIPHNVVQEWLEARKACTAANKHKQECELKILEALGNAELGECELGKVSYLLKQRKGYTVEPSSYRSLTFKKAKVKNGK